TIYDCMVTNSGGNGYFRNEGIGWGAIRAFNNILAFGNHTVAGTVWFYDYSGYSSGWTFENNLYFNNGQALGPYSADTKSVSGNPLFVNASASDYELLAASPAVDKALQSIPFAVPNDFLFKTRPNGAANDIGAFEHY